MTRRRLLLLLLAAANAALALAAWTRQPWANGPAEWRWEYLPAGEAGTGTAASSANHADRGMPGATAGPRLPGQAGGGTTGAPAALAALAALGGLALLCGWRRLAESRGAPVLAVACGAAFTLALVAAQPGGFARVTGALVSRNSFGYVWDAALAPPGRDLLADYPAASAGLNQHSVTHPPGPLLAVRALGWLDRVLPAPAASPATAGDTAGGVRDAGTGGLPSLAAAAIEQEVGRARRHGRPVPQPPPGPWTVAALAVLLPALSALAAWPLYLLARRFALPRRTALLAAVLWLLVPARSLFTPSFDQALPVLLAGAAWLAAGGGRARAAAAGALLFAACFMSYGCLPLLPLVAACAAAAPARGGYAADTGNPAGAGAAPAVTPPPAWQRWGALALGFGLPYLALAIVAGHDPWHAMRAALDLHHRIAVAPRSYATWLLWNPYDFALLLSPGVLGLAAAAARQRIWVRLRRWARSCSLRRTGVRLSRPHFARLAYGPISTASPNRRLAMVAWAWWGLLAALLLSGGVRGEAGRIWLVWMPFACLFAAAAAADPDDKQGDSSGRCRMAITGRAAARLATGGAAAGDQRQGRGTGTAVALLALLASEAALTLALAARMVFVS